MIFSQDAQHYTLQCLLQSNCLNEILKFTRKHHNSDTHNYDKLYINYLRLFFLKKMVPSDFD